MHSGQYGINENQHVFTKMKRRGWGWGVLIILKSNKKIEVTKNKVGV